jgi:hypothetical protein
VKLAYSSAATGEVLHASASAAGEVLQQASTARIRIVRKGPDGREELAADENTELWPGDVVEVTLADSGSLLTSN